MQFKKVSMFYLDNPENPYPELRQRIVDIVLNNIKWVEDCETDMENFFYDDSA